MVPEGEQAMNALPNKSRRQQRQPSLCTVTTYVAGLPENKKLLPYRSFADLTRSMCAKGDRIMAAADRAVKKAAAARALAEKNRTRAQRRAKKG